MTTVLRAMGLTVRKSRDVNEYSLHDGQLAEMTAYADMISEIRQGKAKCVA